MNGMIFGVKCTFGPTNGNIVIFKMQFFGTYLPGFPASSQHGSRRFSLLKRLFKRKFKGEHMKSALLYYYFRCLRIIVALYGYDISARR